MHDPCEKNQQSVSHLPSPFRLPSHVSTSPVTAGRPPTSVARALTRARRDGAAKPAPTPITTKLLPEELEEMCSSEEVAQYRHCVGIARFMVNYVTEAVFAVHVLSKRLSGPTKNDMLRLKRLGGCLLGVRDFGLFMTMAGAIDILD